MGFTLTFDASVKVKRGAHAKNLFRHIARDVDQAADHYFPQRNPNIINSRTPLNVTRVNDGAGGFRVPISVEGRPPSDEFDDYLKNRLGTVQRRLRKDAVLMRPIVLQLDPKWFALKNPNWRQRHITKEAGRYMGAALKWVCLEFGQPNVVGWSLHLDEYHPQLQVMMTPVTEDGRLSQMDFFKGPHDFKRQHTELRAAVAASGFEVEHRVTERSREHLSSSDFQARADRMRAESERLRNDVAKIQTMELKLRSRVAAADTRDEDLIERERNVQAAQHTARQALERAQQMSISAQKAREVALRLQEDLEAERERLSRATKRLEALPPFFEQWLDRTRSGGAPLRERFEADKAKTLRNLPIPVQAERSAPQGTHPGLEL